MWILKIVYNSMWNVLQRLNLVGKTHHNGGEPRDDQVEVCVDNNIQEENYSNMATNKVTQVEIKKLKLLLVAISSGNLEEVKRILDENKSLVNLQYQHEQTTPLIHCIKCDKSGKKLEIFKCLIYEYKADVTLKDPKYNEPVIFHAITADDGEELLKILLETRKIDVNQRYLTDSRTALHHAILRNNFKALKLLLDEQGLLINTTQENGYTALHLAVEKNYPEFVEEICACPSQIMNINFILENKNSLTAMKMNTSVARKCHEVIWKYIDIQNEMKVDPSKGEEHFRALRDELQLKRRNEENKRKSSSPPENNPSNAAPPNLIVNGNVLVCDNYHDHRTTVVEIGDEERSSEKNSASLEQPNWNAPSSNLKNITGNQARWSANECLSQNQKQSIAEAKQTIGNIFSPSKETATGTSQRKSPKIDFRPHCASRDVRSAVNPRNTPAIKTNPSGVESSYSRDAVSVDLTGVNSNQSYTSSNAKSTGDIIGRTPTSSTDGKDYPTGRTSTTDYPIGRTPTTDYSIGRTPTTDYSIGRAPTTDDQDYSIGRTSTSSTEEESYSVSNSDDSSFITYHSDSETLSNTSQQNPANETPSEQSSISKHYVNWWEVKDVPLEQFAGFEPYPTPYIDLLDKETEDWWKSDWGSAR